jgi:MSHA biogenesis protein MshP
MRRQKGFGVIAAVVVVVILALLAAAIVAVGTTQQMTIAQDVQSARAWQAARSGTEWGLFQVLQSPALVPPGTGLWAVGTGGDICPAGGGLGPGVDAVATLNLTADTGFFVTVTGSCWRYNEGESAPGVPQTTVVYQIRAVACPVAGGCPAVGAAVAAPGYIERTRVVVATN